MRADSVQKILEFCDEFVPGEPPEYFFDRLGQSRDYPREMKNISRGRGPTFGDFVTICTEGLMQDVTVARLKSTRVQTPLSPSHFNVMYCVKVSLWTVKIFFAQH
jgi:hypothetical protein